MGCACSSCQSADIQKLSLVYEGGTSRVDTIARGRTTGVGFGRGMGFAAARTTVKSRGTEMTDLARRAAPPERQKLLIWVCVALSALVVGSGIDQEWLSWAVIAGSAFMIWRAWKFNSQVWPSLHARWGRSWLCHRCGNIFEFRDNAG